MFIMIKSSRLARGRCYNGDMSTTRNQRGFTLIELLVVIAIIGLLSSIVLASLNSARAKARDSSRKSELKALQIALELYYTDNGQYPASGPGSGCGTTDSWNRYSQCSTSYIPGLAPKYISALPGLLKSGDNILYSSRSGDSYQSYKLMMYKPEGETVDQDSSWARCSASCAGTGQWCETSGNITSGNNASYFSIAMGTFATCGY